MHGEEAITACKSDASRYLRIFAAFLSPIVEDVAGGEDGRGGDNRLDHVGTVEACLIVHGAVREGKWEEPSFSEFVIDGRGDPIEGDRNVDGRDVSDVQQSMQGASDAHVRTAIDEVPACVGNT